MRLPRQPGSGCSRPGTRWSASARTSRRSWRSSSRRSALTYPLLSDPDKTILDAWGAYGEKSLYGKTVTGVIRSTVVVGEDGTVELAKYNVKATGHVASLRKALGLAARLTPRPWGPARFCARLSVLVAVPASGSGETGSHAGFRFLCLRA